MQRINPDPVETHSTFLRKDDKEIPYPPEKQEDAAKEVHDDQLNLFRIKIISKEKKK